MRLPIAISLVLLLFVAATSFGDEKKEIQRGKFQQDLPSGSYYWAFVPDACKDDGNTGLILVLHGSGGTADGMLSCFMWNGNDGASILESGNYICVCPKSKATEGWDYSEPGPMEAYKDITTKYKINKKRALIFGYSAGGFFTSKFYYDNLDLFNAGIIAAAFLASSNMGVVKKNPNKPMFFIHGETDPNRQGAEESYNTLIKFGSKTCRKFFIPGEGHNISFQNHFPMLFRWVTAMESGYDYATNIEKAEKQIKSKVEDAIKTVADIEKHPKEDGFWEQLGKVKKAINEVGEKRLKSSISMLKSKPADLIKKLLEYEETYKGYPVADKAKEERLKLEGKPPEKTEEPAEE